VRGRLHRQRRVPWVARSSSRRRGRGAARVSRSPRVGTAFDRRPYPGDGVRLEDDGAGVDGRGV
jgi:hypothetical protein